jgi:lysozyme
MSENDYPRRAFDVSGNNGRVDWKKVRHEAGYRHAFAKASEGESFVDDNLRRNVTGARSNGIALGLYHFAHPSESPQANARHFLRTIIPHVRVGDPAPTLDLEVAEGLSRWELWRWQHTFCRIVAEALNVVPMIYGSASFLDSIPWPRHHRPFWGAEWGHVSAATLRSWHVWQYSAVGRVAGIYGVVDLDSILRPIPTIRRIPR